VFGAVIAKCDGARTIGEDRRKPFGQSIANVATKLLSGLTVTLVQWKHKRGTMALFGLSKSKSNTPKEHKN
jgi:hypothetical protein